MSKEELKQEEQKETQSKPKKKGGNKSIIFIILILAIAIGSFMIFKGKSDNSPVVAIVNGVEIKESEVNSKLDQVKKSLELQGSTPDEQTLQGIRSQVVESLINDQILLQKAKESGINISKDEAVKQLETIKNQIGDEVAFQEQLNNIGRTEDQLVADIRVQLTIQKYVADTIDESSISVTDEEIQAFYDQVKTTQPDLPEINEVRDQIETQISNTKIQELGNQLIKRLREEATVEIL